MTAEPVSPPPLLNRCPLCRLLVPLLVEGSDLCLGCDSLIPTRAVPGDDVMVQNLGNPLAYIGGGDGHRPIPMATDVGIRPTHQRQAGKPTGLDWSKHTSSSPTTAVTQLPTTRACKECRVDTDLEDLVDGFCPVCADAATARFKPTGTAPHDQRTPVPVQHTEPTREVVNVATPKQPAYVDDIVAVMVATDGHPDPAVRTARKVVANALVALHKTLGGVFPQTPAAAASPSAAAGTTTRSYKRLTNAEVFDICHRYQAGESTTQLGKAFGVSAKTISNKLHAAGIPVRPKTGAK